METKKGEKPLQYFVKRETSLIEENLFNLGKLTHMCASAVICGGEPEQAPHGQLNGDFACLYIFIYMYMCSTSLIL